MTKKATEQVVTVSAGDKRFVFLKKDIEKLAVEYFLPSYEALLQKLRLIWGKGGPFTVGLLFDTPLDLIKSQAPDCLLILAVLMKRFDHWFMAGRNRGRSNPDLLLAGRSETDFGWIEGLFSAAVEQLIFDKKLVPQTAAPPEDKTDKVAVCDEQHEAETPGEEVISRPSMHNLLHPSFQYVISEVLGANNAQAIRIFRAAKVFYTTDVYKVTLEWFLALEGITPTLKNGILKRMIESRLVFRGSNYKEMQEAADKLPEAKSRKRLKACPDCSQERQEAAS